MLLLDEPLSALDAHTRDTVRGELRELLAALALPTILVTHDFEDAAALADRVGVIVDGRLLQVGTPSELVASAGRPVRRELHRGDPAAGRRGARARRADRGSCSTAAASAWTTDAGLGRVAVAVLPVGGRGLARRRPTTRR